MFDRKKEKRKKAIVLLFTNEQMYRQTNNEFFADY